MTIGLFLVFALVCLAADLAARQILARHRAHRRRREREEALRVSLQLDFTREAKSLKRVEVALNIQTFINLHAYGYSNVKELGPLLDVKTTRIPFEGRTIDP